MVDELPDDADGDALRRLVATGSDLSREMEIDFAMDVPDRESGLAFAVVGQKMGFRTRVSRDTETGEWTCYCTCTMIPSYDDMISIQDLLEEAGRPYTARPDGWGSFGNAPEVSDRQ